ncbi:sideroflexin-4 isoform X2 [Erinaceus europaeus]|uniref:Sideroflexin-4 isoform X2 n=1 Tax=Erinaceus europaeus TaxID=9365 RepID=A0ABM3VS84_ERIEU|nr:sideroflexin-4 isoform X2 [Erinaceus europaeus]
MAPLLLSFPQRVLHWTELLDPTNLILSIEQIEKSRQILLTSEDAVRFDLKNERIQEAWKRSLATVHPDSSRLIPVAFRPAALLPFSMPLLFVSLVTTKTLKSMLLPQVSFYTYLTAFNMFNGNATYSRRRTESIMLGAGVIASSTFFGLVPRLRQVKSALLRRSLPALLVAHISGVNLVASRSLETIRGIEVMDKDGNVIGYSRKAGTKAVRETAASRVLLFGTSAFIPELFSLFIKQYKNLLPFPWTFWALKMSCTIFVMSLMVPVSFSIYPQIGQIQRGQLEEEIQSATEDTELFYNRGV